LTRNNFDGVFCRIRRIKYQEKKLEFRNSTNRRKCYVTGHWKIPNFQQYLFKNKLRTEEERLRFDRDYFAYLSDIIG